MLLRKRLKKYSKAEIVDAYISVFTSSPKGRLVLLHLSHICHLDETTYAGPGGNDETNEREGERRVILHILNMIDQDVFDHLTAEIGTGEEQNEKQPGKYDPLQA